MIWALVGMPIELAAGGRVIVRASLGAGVVGLEAEPGIENEPGPAVLTAQEARRVRVMLDAAISVADRGEAA